MPTHYLQSLGLIKSDENIGFYGSINENFDKKMSIREKLQNKK